MIDPSRRLVPSTVPEDHPIHDAAEAGELARVRVFLDQQPSLVHDINRAGGHPLHRAVIGGSADMVTLLLDRGADIHAIHGAGVGSFEGYAPQDKQPIDLAIWGGPRQAPLSRWRCYANGLTWLLWRRWRPGRRVWPGNGNVRLARLLIGRGATYDLTVASVVRTHPRAARVEDAGDAGIGALLAPVGHRQRLRVPLRLVVPPPNSAVSTSSACCWNAAQTRRGPTPIRPSAAPPYTPRRGVATGRWSNCC